MRLTYFFKGTNRKEQIASAFLATLLNEMPSFREFFFQRAFPAESAALAGYAWKVDIEANMVDVTLSSLNTVVIIENKIRAGAKQGGQLVRYYEEQKGRDRDRRVLAVYLAPRNVGTSEVADLRRELKGGDLAAHISWEKMLEFNAKGDSDEHLIESAFEEIRLVLNDHAKYLHEGDRGTIGEVADEAIELLRPVGVRLGRWTGRDFEEILTYGTPATVWLDAAFDAEDAQPWLPKDVRISEDTLRLTIRAQFRLSGWAAKDPQMRARWEMEFPDPEVTVGGLVYRRGPGSGWFKQQREMIGTPRELAANMATVGKALLEFLTERIEGAGLPS